MLIHGLCAQVAALIPNPAAPKKGRKDKDTEVVDEKAQYKQFLHELPPKMALMMNRYAAFLVLQDMLAQLFCSFWVLLYCKFDPVP